MTDANEDPRPEEPPEPPSSIDAEFSEFKEMDVIGTGGNADVTNGSYDGNSENTALKQPRIRGM